MLEWFDTETADLLNARAWFDTSFGADPPVLDPISGSLSVAIGEVTSSSDVHVVAEASAASAIGDVAVSATGQAIVSGRLSLTIKPIKSWGPQRLAPWIPSGATVTGGTSGVVPAATGAGVASQSRSGGGVTVGGTGRGVV